MKMVERIELLEGMIAENPNALATWVPNETLEVILAHCRNRDEIKASELNWRSKAKWYEESYRTAKEENKRLKQEMRKLNGHSKTKQHAK